MITSSASGGRLFSFLKADASTGSEFLHSGLEIIMNVIV